MVKRSILCIMLIAIMSLVACMGQTGEISESSTTTTTMQTTTAKQTSVVTTTKTETTTVKSETTKEENPFATKMEISWVRGGYTGGEAVDGRWDEVALEEKFNVDIQLWKIRVDSNNMEQVQMMLAAGDVPDYGFYYTTGQYLHENGMGRTIPLDMIKQFYPSYYELLMKEPIGLAFNKVDDAVDEYYGLAMYSPFAYYDSWVPVWRLDWLQNLGYSLDNLTPMEPALRPDEWSNKLYYSNTVLSFDDVREVMRAFTEDDPDGNGVDDTYGSPFANSAYDGYITNSLFGFQKDGTHFYKDYASGDYVPYYAYSNYKSMLSFLSEMLDKGYIRWIPGIEAYHLELRSIWNTGKTGFINTLNAPRVLGPGYGDGDFWPPAAILLGVDPEATFVILRAGEGKFSAAQVWSWSPMMYCVGDVSDEKLARIFQIVEYSQFGDDWLRYKWGVEGVHYKWTGEPFKSSVVFTEADKVPEKYKMCGQFGNANFLNDLAATFNYDAHLQQFINFWEEYSEDGYYGNKLWIRPDKYYSVATMPFNLYKEFETLRSETIDQISTVHKEFITRVWDGQVANLDSEWEQYLDQLYSVGLEKWVKIWNSEEIKSLDYYNSLN